MNFYQPSKRHVSPSKAAEIIDALAPVAKTKNIQPPAVVGVFVNHSIDEIDKIARSLRLTGIQLHGDETTVFYHALKQRVNKNSSVCSPLFIRAIRTQPASDEGRNSNRDAEKVRAEILSWSAAAIDLVLLDAAATNEFGGTGKTIDWTRVPNFQTILPQRIVLAGGLNPENVRRAIEISKVQIVDVASGVESEPGKKDALLVGDFVSAAKLAFENQSRHS